MATGFRLEADVPLFRNFQLALPEPMLTMALY
jgi:hypothetical protein